METRRKPLFDPIFAVLLFFGSLALTYRFALIEFDPHHTGLMYKTALDIANGGVLFRDTFTQYGALVSYLQAGALLLFGRRVTSILLCTAVAYAADFVLFYFLARRFFARGWAAALSVGAVCLAPFWFWAFHPWCSVFALFFTEAAALFALAAAESRRAPWFALGAGAAAALAFWCRQPVGIVMLLACCIVFGVQGAVYRKKEAARARRMALCLPAAVAGAAVVVGVGLLLIARAGALADFYRQSIAGMFRFAADRADADAGFGAIAKVYFCLVTAPFAVGECKPLDGLWTLLPLCSVALFVLCARRILRQVRSKATDADPARTRALATYAVFAVAAWHQYYPVYCYRHWYWGGMLSVISAAALLFLLGEKWLTRPRVLAWLARGRAAARRTAVLALLLAVVFLPNVGYRVVRGAIRAGDERVVMQNENNAALDGLYLAPDVAAHYNAFFDDMALLRTAEPTRPAVNCTQNGIYAVECVNFHPAFASFGSFYYDDYDAALADHLASERPIVIGPECPDGYVLWRAARGDSGDEYAAYHDLPANIYLPAECYEALPDGLK